MLYKIKKEEEKKWLAIWPEGQTPTIVALIKTFNLKQGSIRPQT